MRKKIDPRVARHLHADLDVTPQRVRAFGKEKYATRLLVLAELRSRASDDGLGVELSVVALGLAAFSFLVVPSSGISFTDMPLLAAAIVSLIMTLLIFVALLPIVGPGLLKHYRRGRANVWLGAYMDEIERRQSSAAKKDADWPSGPR